MTALPLNEIVCGDSLGILKGFPDASVDIVVTSPPYGFGMDYDEHDDSNATKNDWDAYFAKLFDILDEGARVLAPGGRLIINVQPLFSDYVPTHHRISHHLTSVAGLRWRNEILWEKNHYSAKVSSWGSWKSPSAPYLKYTWEFVEVFCKDSIKKAPRIKGAAPDISGDEFKAWTTPAKWSIAPERNMDSFGHPAMMPVALADRLVRLFSFPGDVVLDPFCGAGTTCLAAKESGRPYVGIDISEAYCATARARLADPALLVPDNGDLT